MFLQKFLRRSPKPQQIAKQDLSVFELDHKKRILKVLVPPQSAFKCSHQWFVGGNGGILAANSFYTADQPAECLLSPQQDGEVSILDINGKLKISSKAYLAATQSLDVSNSLHQLNVNGTGKLAIGGPGSILPMELQHGEEYLISKKHLLAWDGDVQLVENFRVKQDIVAPTASLVTFAQYWTLNQSRYYLAWLSYQIRARFYGEDALYRLSGPQKFWISSRKL